MKARRNDPCPCGSGKKYKKCCMQQEASAPPVIWQDEKGFHIVSLGTTPSAEQLELMTKRYQNEMRNSPLWKDIVKDFGEEKAEELLKEFEVKLGDNL